MFLINLFSPSDIVFLLSVVEEVKELGVRRSKHSIHLLKLVIIVRTREEGFSCDHLGKNAANRPHITGYSTILLLHHGDFWCPVPTGHDVVCQMDATGHQAVSDWARKSEITDLQDAIVIDEKVLWLEISM